MRQNVARICRTRTDLMQGLRQLGFFVWDSAANFVLARSNSLPAAQLYQELKERRILVRYFNQPRLDDCLRITVGTDDEIKALLDQLQDLLKTR